MTRPRATTSPSDALGATIADLKARLARLENIAHQHRVLGSHLGLQEVLYFDTVGTASFVKGDYPWLRAIRVRVQAGGGGGGGASATASNETAAGTGGAGGGYSESFITDLSIVTDPITVTVGGGGSVSSGSDGGDGGPSSFGSLVTAVGGGGGFAALGPATFSRPRGGVPITALGTGQIRVAGGGSGAAQIVINAAVNMYVAQGSHGGNAVLGTGASATGTGALAGGINGSIGSQYGGGGGGAVNHTSQSSRPGGAGGQGIVIVELYA